MLGSGLNLVIFLSGCLPEGVHTRAPHGRLGAQVCHAQYPVLQPETEAGRARLRGEGQRSALGTPEEVGWQKGEGIVRSAVTELLRYVWTGGCCYGYGYQYNSTLDCYV